MDKKSFSAKMCFYCFIGMVIIIILLNLFSCAKSKADIQHDTHKFYQDNMDSYTIIKDSCEWEIFHLANYDVSVFCVVHKPTCKFCKERNNK